MRPFLWILVLVSAAAGCSPSLDWREVRPEGAGALALFPCKPEVINRPAGAGSPSRMGLAQCRAAGQSFALSWAQVPDALQVTSALQQMRESVASKLAASAAPAQPLQVPGMTPNPQALSQRLSGRQQAQVAVFSRGPLVYQAMMLGEKRNDAAWETFVTSVKLIE